MVDAREEWIAKRAYALWELSGCGHGRDGEHWAQAVAEREALERTRATCDGAEVLVRFRLKPGPRRPANQAGERFRSTGR